MAKAKVNDLNILREQLKDNALGIALLDKAVFMEKTLADLQQEITSGGVVTKMCQGSYDIDRANPALQAYNTTIKNYTTVIKQLNDMLPSEPKKTDTFKEF